MIAYIQKSIYTKPNTTVYFICCSAKYPYLGHNRRTIGIPRNEDVGVLLEDLKFLLTSIP